MRTLKFFVSCSLLVAAPCFSADTINPRHTILLEGYGWVRISHDGRWLSYTNFQNRAVEPTQLFRLDQTPVGLFRSRETLTSGHNSPLHGKWFIDFANPKTAHSENLGYRVWNLDSTSGTPALILGPGYSNCSVNATETHLAAVYLTAQGLSMLRMWDLQKQPLRIEDYRELGQLTGKVGNGRYAFTTNNGIMAISDNTVSRWDINSPDEAPATLKLENAPNQVWTTNEWWSGGMSMRTEARAIYWKNGTDKMCLTDIPENPTKHAIWELRGQPRIYVGKYLVEWEGGVCWLTTFDGGRASTRKLCECPTGVPDTLRQLRDNKYVLISSHRLSMDYLTGIETQVCSLEDPQSPPAIIEKRQTDDLTKPLDKESNSYVATTSGKWLVGISKTKTSVWDLTKPLNAASAQTIANCEESVRAHFLADDRWLVLVLASGKCCFVDLNAESSLQATEFFRLESLQDDAVTHGAAGGRILIVEWKKKPVREARALVWDVSEFARLASRQ